MVHSNAKMRFGKVSNRVVVSAGCLNKTPGGNEALPPRWQLFEVGGNVYYQGGDMVMVTSNRPLPGVRLGERMKSYDKQGTHS